MKVKYLFAKIISLFDTFRALVNAEQRHKDVYRNLSHSRDARKLR